MSCIPGGECSNQVRNDIALYEGGSSEIVRLYSSFEFQNSENCIIFYSECEGRADNLPLNWI